MKNEDRADNVVVLPDLTAVNAEAAKWAISLEDGELSPVERAEFLAWRDTSSKHQEAFERLAGRWEEFDCVAAFVDCAASDDRIGLAEKDASDLRWRRIAPPAMMGLAASLVLFVAVQMLHGKIGGIFGAGVYETAIGEQKTIALNDGSRIYLNTNSKVKVRYSASARRVMLLGGEAYFDVSKDRQRPFSVFAGERVVTAVGTAFTVRLVDQETRVTVEEGRVALFLQRAGESAAGDKGARSEPAVEISAGQNAVLSETVEKIGDIQPDQLARQLSWREGVLAFSADPLSNVITEVSRYTDVAIEIDDAQLLNMPVNGYFKIGDVEEMFEALEIMTGLKMERVESRRVRFVRVDEG